jgi:predicted DsbA family dithiol-disulfide isomerase
MRIDIFQDTVCPWCRIGKQHLFEAIARWDGEPIDIHYRAFLLDPTTPMEGRPASSLIEKFGSEERVSQAHAHVCQAGEACGLNFDFTRIDKFPNTLLSHQLIQVTPNHLETQMVDAIMQAYFEGGKDIGSIDVLVAVAEQVGLNPEETREKLIRGDGVQAVQSDLQFAEEAGISGVPLFILNHRLAVSGAQPVELFLQAFNHAQSGE